MVKQGNKPQYIPDKSIIFDPDFGVAVLNHCGGGVSDYTAKTVSGKTVAIDSGREYIVIATPSDLADRFLLEVSDRLVIDGHLKLAKELFI